MGGVGGEWGMVDTHKDKTAGWEEGRTGGTAGAASGPGAAASRAPVSAAGSAGGGGGGDGQGGGGGQAEGEGESDSGEAQFVRLFEAKFGLAAPPPPVAAAHGAVGAAAAGPAASAPATTPPPPPSHLAHVPEPSPLQGIPLASSPAARGSARAAGGAAGDEAECCVCMEGRKTHVFIPCRHMCVCAGCASEIMAGSKACPMCRGVSTDCFEIYI
jgi:hypothetical protein